MEVEKSCVTFLLCGPCWYVHKLDVQNKWDDNTERERDWAEGRLIATYFDIFLFLFCTLLIVSCCQHKVGQYFHVKCIKKNCSSLDGHGARFSARRGARV